MDSRISKSVVVTVVLVVVTAVLVVALVALAQSQPGATSRQTQPADSGSSPVEVQPQTVAAEPMDAAAFEAALREARADDRVLSPMMKEIRSEFAARQEAIAALKVRLDAATDEQTYLTVVREMEQIKIGAEIRILEIQAAYARREGRLDQANEIEAAIADMRKLSEQRATQVTSRRESNQK